MRMTDPILQKKNTYPDRTFKVFFFTFKYDDDKILIPDREQHNRIRPFQKSIRIRQFKKPGSGFKFFQNFDPDKSKRCIHRVGQRRKGFGSDTSQKPLIPNQPLLYFKFDDDEILLPDGKLSDVGLNYEGDEEDADEETLVNRVA